jgi:hypothetical protein
LNLPNSDRVRIDQAKVTDYLLAPDHPEGASKAAFFVRFGFTLVEWQVLTEALTAHARANPVASMTASEHGVKYRVDGPIHCPDGRSPMIRTVWIVDAGSEIPRLVTAHPL